MGDLHSMASRENNAAERAWNYGGSNRYPASLPARPRPRQAPKPEPAVVQDDRQMSAYDEAIEHVNWCRMRGMSPQDIGESIESRHVPHTWGAAIDILERYIVKTRAKGPGGRQ